MGKFFLCFCLLFGLVNLRMEICGGCHCYNLQNTNRGIEFFKKRWGKSATAAIIVPDMLNVL